MKEMVGGCCVCSDESGSPENPLVYCDGDGCTVAVHQACYGIVSVPAGSWYCKRCESQERAARVRCCLCPSRDGALKRTDNQQWAHVVCALYIPEIRFGNVTTMEPIMLHSVPPDRWKQTCYVCEAAGKEERCKMGACMPCNKPNCKNSFHVTCAQAKGLLCEEQGRFADDNVKYCGYCSHHYQKILNSSEKVMMKDGRRFTLVASRKDYPTIKPIPAFRPVPSARSAGSPDSSPEKKSPASYSSGYSSFSSKDHGKDLPDTGRTKDTGSRSAENKEFGSGKKPKKDSSSRTAVTGGASTSSSTNSHSTTSIFSKRDSSSLTGSKDREKDSFAKEKEREKERQEKERERERAKELISSRPFDEKPAGGQFSLSSFINPNLANKIQSKKQPELSSSSSSSLAASKSSDSNHKEKPVSGNNREKDHSLKSVNEKTSSKLSSSSSLSSSSKKESESLKSSKASDKSLDAGKKSSSSKKAPTSSSSSLKSAGVRGDKSSKSDSRSKSKDSPFAGSSNNKSGKESSRRSSDTSTETDDEPIIKKSKLSPALSSSSSSLADKSSPDTDGISSSRKAANKKKASNKSTASGKLNQTGSGIGKKSSSAAASTISSAGLHSSASSSSSSTAHSSKGSKDKSFSSAAAPVVNGRGEGKKSSTASAAAGATLAAGSSNAPSSSSLSSGRKRKTSTSLKSATGSKSRSKGRTCSRDEDDDDEDEDADEEEDDVSSNGTEPNLDEVDTVPEVTSGKSTRNKKSVLPSPSPSLTPMANRRLGTAVHSIDMGRSFVLPHPPSVKSSAAKLVTKDPTEPPPSSLESLLERQWGQGAQFVMEQAQHYDIASLLSCLSQIRQDNERLEERLRQLTSRREHLLTVNARLALPLNGSFPGTLSHMPVFSSQLAAAGPHSSSSLPPFIAPQPPSIHHLLSSSPLDPSLRRLSSSSASGDPMSLSAMNGRYPPLAMDPGTLNSIFPSSGERGGFSLNNSLRSTPSPSSRSSPFAPSSRPGSVNPRDPLGLNPSPVPGGLNHRAPPDKR